MTSRVQEIIKETGVLQEGHFVLSSGLHADKYLQCALALQHPKYARELGQLTRQLWPGVEVDAVIGPALGGIVYSYVVAESFNCRSIFAERKQGKMSLRRGFALNPGERVLVVEDVVTTGGSVKEVLGLLTELKVEIVGISSIIDRSRGGAEFNHPFKSLLQLNIKSYPEDECQMCKKGLPFDKPGSRKEV